MIPLVIILFLSLFGPTPYYNQIFILNTGILVLAYGYRHSQIKDHSKALVLILKGIIALCIKLFFFQSTEDVKWFLRYLQFVLLIFYLKSLSNESLDLLYKLLSIYIIASFFIAILEVLRMHNGPILQFMKRFYWSEIHSQVRYRAKAFNPGPGNFGLRLVMINLVFAYKLIRQKFSTLDVITYMLTLILAMFANSRTALGALALILIPVFLSSKYKSAFMALILIAPSLKVVEYFSFERVNRLLDKGVANDSSALGRFDKWDILVTKALEQPFYVLTGWSESMFTQWGAITDSEFMTVLLYFGLIGFALIVYFQVSFLGGMISSSKDKVEQIFFGCVLFSIVLFQTFSSFFTDYIAIIFIFVIGLEFSKKSSLEVST